MSSRPRSSKTASSHSRSTSAADTSSRPSSSKKRGASAAGNVVRSLSSRRAASARSVAWSDQITEEELPVTKPEDIALEESSYAKELEEELALGSGDSATGIITSENEPIGCWSQFIRTLSSFWNTTDMHLGEAREVLMQTSLREFAVYLVFLAILCIVTLSSMNQTMYRYTDIIRNQFSSHSSVNQIGAFWKFLEGPLVDGIYNEHWYNDGDMKDEFPCPANDTKKRGPCKIEHEDRMMLYANRLLGVPRLRQLRVHNRSCSIPVMFKDFIKVCYNHYDSAIEDKSDFRPNKIKYSSADAWKYQSVKELEGNEHWGQQATYSGAGSVQNLRETRSDTLAIIKELKEGLWIGRGTRYVSVDFTLYNANVNFFCVIKLNFEFQPTGGILPQGQFGTVKLLRYITKADYALMGTEIVFALFIMYYLIEEALEIRKMKLEYFQSFWNCMDLFVLVVSIATLSFNLYCFLTVTSLLKGLLAQPELFADFSYLEVWSKTFQNVAAVTVFVGWCKVFKYISFNKTMAQLSGTIQRCASDVAAFSVMFFIVFFAYAQIGYLMFGVHMSDYSTFKDACYTQFRLILGDFNFPAIEQSHRIWGPVYFLTYVFLVFFVLMNMFLAIINDTYSEVKEEVETRKEEFEVVDLLKRGYNSIREAIHERDKLLDLKETVKLAADDGVVTYDEIRDKLRALNFSDIEIEVFVARYDKDGDFEFNLEEINAIEQNLGEQFENYDHLKLENEREHQRPITAQETPIPVLPKMTVSQYRTIKNRIDGLEGSMSLVVRKVEQALIALENIEPTPRPSSAFNRGVRGIASAKGGSAEKRRDLENLVRSELNQLDGGQ